MTLKQLKTIEALPKCNYNIGKAMLLGGKYSKASSRSGYNYQALRRITQKLDFFSPEAIKKDIAKTRRLATKKQDITNLNRIDEHRSKIAGMITDKSENINKNIIEERKTELESYYNNLIKSRITS